jgi:hypothetical protein
MKKLILFFIIILFGIPVVSYLLLGVVNIRHSDAEVTISETQIVNNEVFLTPAPTRDPLRPTIFNTGSKDGTYKLLGRSNEAGVMRISILDFKTQKVLVEDVLEKNYGVIGYGTKFGCQCQTLIDGWYDDQYFGILIQNANDEEYTYKLPRVASNIISKFSTDLLT